MRGMQRTLLGPRTRSQSLALIWPARHLVASALPAGMDIRHACYAHCWDRSRTRLFVCGGPLAFGLQGCYMAVWH